jgi:hypothetical protein
MEVYLKTLAFSTSAAFKQETDESRVKTMPSSNFKAREPQSAMLEWPLAKAW